MTSSHLDSLKRTPSTGSASTSVSRRSWLWFPLLLAGFALCSFFLFGERLLPRLEVKTTPAILLETNKKTSSNVSTEPQTITQASGWIEPDPYPIRVPVRVDGLVETVEVLAGQQVQKGQLLATLDPTDFKYRLQSIEASLLAAEAVRKEKEQAVLRAAAEDRRSRAGVEAATARLREQEDRLRRVLALEAGVVPEDDRLQVEREVAVGKADLAAAKAELEANQAQLAVETAGIETAKARVADLNSQVEQARTNLARTKIFSPLSGVVLKRFASPGGKRMMGMDDPDSVSIVSLYDPDHLQVRVDVPLADAAEVVEGTPARIQLSLFPDRTFAGKVTRIVGEADLTRNTLQVKVAIEEPEVRMRPEMLCRVEFLSFPSVGKPSTGSFRASETVWIPVEAIQKDDRVWVVDAISQRAEIREVELGAATRENYRAVRKGLRPGERVIMGNPKGLKAGIRLKEMETEDI